MLAFYLILVSLPQLENEKSIKNATITAYNEYYSNYSSFYNTTDVPPLDIQPADAIRGPCWETAVGIVSIQTLKERCQSACGETVSRSNDLRMDAFSFLKKLANSDILQWSK